MHGLCSILALIVGFLDFGITVAVYIVLLYCCIVVLCLWILLYFPLCIVLCLLIVITSSQLQLQLQLRIKPVSGTYLYMHPGRPSAYSYLYSDNTVQWHDPYRNEMTDVHGSWVVLYQPGQITPQLMQITFSCCGCGRFQSTRRLWFYSECIFRDDLQFVVVVKIDEHIWTKYILDGQFCVIW